MGDNRMDWVHGDLSGDDEFRASWAAYLTQLLRDGMTITDARFIAARLQRVALDNLNERVSINAAADLHMFAVALEQKAGKFRNAFHMRIPEGLELRQVIRGIIANEDRRGMYLEVRRTALQKLERCRSGEITGWSELWGAWLDYLVSERVVFRWWPAENHTTAKPSDEVGKLFDEEQYQVLSKADSELEEAFADIFTSMMLYASDDAQEKLHHDLLVVDANHGKLQARAQLRQMRQQFQVAPWNFARWEAELRTGLSQEPKRYP